MPWWKPNRPSDWTRRFSFRQLPGPQRPEHPDLRGLPVRFAPGVETRTWQESGDGGMPILHREFRTPDGVLATSLQVSDDWLYGGQIPFVTDYRVPRGLKQLVTGPEDLPALAHLLAPPTAEDVAAFQQEAARARSFAGERGVLLVGGWGVGADMLNWLCGMEQLMALTHTDPGFVADLFEMVHVWNKRRMELVLSGAWTCTFAGRGMKAVTSFRGSSTVTSCFPG